MINRAFGASRRHQNAPDLSIRARLQSCRKVPTEIRALQAAEKREFLEGDGLQAVHKCFAVNPALAAEGAAFAPYSTFFRSL